MPKVTKLWDFFTRSEADKDKAICKDCEKTLNCKKGTTSSIRIHLRSMHPELYEECERGEAQLASGYRSGKRLNKDDDDEDAGAAPAPTPKRAKRQVQKYDGDSPRQKDLEAAVVEWMCFANVPFSMMDNKMWRVMMEKFDPKFICRSRSTYSRDRVPALYADLRKEVDAALDKDLGGQDGIAFTSDLWTSRNNDAYISLTIHYVDKGFRLKRFLISCSPFPGQHTGQLIAEKLDPVIVGLQLPETCHRWCVSDRGSNMVAAVRLSDQFYDQYFCVDHTIHLVVTQAIAASQRFGALIEKCKRLASHLNQSTISRGLLKRTAEGSDERYVKVMQSCPTRWNSEYLTITSIIANAKSLEVLWAEQCQFADRIPTPQEWPILEEAVKILKVFYVASEVLSADSTPTIQEVVPQLYNIEEQLKMDFTHEEVQELADNLAEKLNSRLPRLGTTIMVNAMASMLDPRFKGMLLKTVDRYEDTKAALQVTFEESQSLLSRESTPMSQDEEEEDESHLTPSQLFRKRELRAHPAPSLRRHNSVNSIKSELKVFLETRACEEDEDIMQWWGANARTFPKLARVARKIFCIPASSTSSERTFSSAGRVVTDRRTNLEPDLVEKVVFIKENLLKLRNY